MEAEKSMEEIIEDELKSRGLVFEIINHDKVLIR
jgi:hypothetical protein